MRALYDTCAAASVSNPRTKREMDNNATRLGYLFWQLNEGTAAPPLCKSVQITCSCTCCLPSCASSDLVQHDHIGACSCLP